MGTDVAALPALDVDKDWTKLASPAGLNLSGRAKTLVLVAVVLLLILFAAAGEIGTAPSATADGAAVLALVSIVAVGIERIIETFWTVATRLKHAWWPLDQVGLAIADQVAAMNNSVKPVFDEASWTKAMKEGSDALLRTAREKLESADWTSAEALKEAVLAAGEAHGLKLGKAQAPVRVAVTGRTVGLPLFESLEVLGKEKTLARIDTALAKLTS